METLKLLEEAPEELKVSKNDTITPRSALSRWGKAINKSAFLASIEGLRDKFE